MQIINHVSGLESLLGIARTAKKTIGFVPTMGALHAGHMSLVSQCIEENDVCVVSIFVNPTQFNDPGDLLRYPRMEEEDCRKLQDQGCDIVFIPSVEEMYPEPDTRVFDFGRLDKVMEGVYRPGHFNGVAQVVSKLFEMVQPDKAYFGEKDFQQLAVIRKMVGQLNLNITIVPCPIVREKDGLAMSSRNRLLTEKQRKAAPAIRKILLESLDRIPEKSVRELQQWVIETINEKGDLRTEYFEIVDGNTLESIQNWKDSGYIVGCITVFCGPIRLIDNIQYMP